MGICLLFLLTLYLSDSVSQIGTMILASQDLQNVINPTEEDASSVNTRTPPPPLKNELLRNILLYGLIGLVSAGVDVLLFRLLIYTLGYPVLFSNVFTVIIGITISFTLNRKYNFKVTDRVIRRYVIFFCVGMCGLALSELMLFIGDQIGIEPFAVKLVSVFVVALVQFVLNKTISFKATETIPKASSDD